MRSAAKQYWKRAIALALVLSLALSLCFTTTFAVDEDDAAEPEETTVYEVICGKQAHLHGSECYSKSCEYQDLDGHSCGQECYQLTCALEEHTHSLGCMNELGVFPKDEKVMAQMAVCCEEEGHTHNFMCGVPYEAVNPTENKDPADEPAEGEVDGETNTPGDGENSGDANTPSDGENGGDANTPGDGENSGDANTPGDGENSGDANTPGDGENGGNANTPGDGENSGNANTPGDGENSGNTDNGEDSGDTTAPDNGEDSGDASTPDNGEIGDNTDNVEGGEDNASTPDDGDANAPGDAGSTESDPPADTGDGTTEFSDGEVPLSALPVFSGEYCTAAEGQHIHGLECQRMIQVADPEDLVMPAETFVAKIGGTTYDTLSDAVSAAKSGDTIVLGQDITESVAVAQNITIDLGGHTWTGDGKSTLSIADSKAAISVTVKNGTVMAAEGYRAIVAGNADLTLDGVAMEPSGSFANEGMQSSSFGGGCVYISKGALTVKNCTFSGDAGKYKESASYMGAGKFIEKDAYGSHIFIGANVVSASISGSTFSKSQSPNGTVYATGKALTVSNSTFSNNGNGLQLNGTGSFDISNVTFTESGKAVNVSSKATVSLTDCTITKNPGDGSSSGCLLNLVSANVTITRGKIFENTTIGKVISSSSGTLTMDGTEITDNTVNSVVSTSSSTVTLKNIAATGNQSSLYMNCGGGVFSISANGKTVTLENVTAANNEATKSSGGAAYITGNASTTVNIKGCSFTGNTAKLTGGALYLDNKGTTTITDTTITGNTANNTGKVGGGGIYVNNSTGAVILDGSTRVYSNETPKATIKHQNTHEAADIALNSNYSKTDFASESAVSRATLTLNNDSFELDGTTYTLTKSEASGLHYSSGSGSSKKYYWPAGYYTTKVEPAKVYVNAPAGSHNGEKEITVDSLSDAVAKAQENNAKTIYVCGNTTVDMSDAPSLNSGLTFMRCTEHPNGHMFTINGNVTLDSAHIDGNKVDGNSAMIYVPSRGHLTITGDTVIENGKNTAEKGRGGAIYVSQGSLTMTGGTINNNSAREGGGIYALGGTLVSFEGGTVSNNVATGGNGGGGAYIEATSSEFGVQGGRTTFDGNKANELGGGVFLVNGVNAQTHHFIYRADFTNNSSYRTGYYYDGGAIYIQSGTTAHMKNVYVSGNTDSDKANNGYTAVAVCPTGELAVYELNGLLAINNGENPDIGVIAGGVVPSVSPKVYLPNNAPGGGEVQYTYSDGTVVNTSDYQFIEGYFRLYTQASSSAIDAARDTAERDGVVITGNYATQYGSGIMTNGLLKIGTETTTLKVTKVWDDGAENHNGEQILVYLTKDNEVVPADFRSDSTVILNAENNWTYTWTNLGNEFTWGVKEAAVGDYTSDVKVEKDTQFDAIADRYFIATITNNLGGDNNKLVIRKTAIDLDPENSYQFTLKLGNIVNGGAFALRVEETGELIPIYDNEVTFYLKGGQTAVVEGLPDGFTYELTEAEGEYSTFIYESVTANEGGAGQIYSVDVVNVSIKPADGIISGTKVLNGRDFQKGDHFTFKIEACPEPGKTDESAMTTEDIAKTLPEKKLVTIYPGMTEAEVEALPESEDSVLMAGKVFSFDLHFTKPGTYHYVVNEKRPESDSSEYAGIPGVTYDPMQYHVIVEVNMDENGELKPEATTVWARNTNARASWPEINLLTGEDGATIPIENALRFENTYNPAEITRFFLVRKILVNKDLKAGDFNFILTPGGSAGYSGSSPSENELAGLVYSADQAQPMPTVIYGENDTAQTVEPDENGNIVVGNGPSGHVTFDGIKFTAEQAGKVYKYTIREEIPAEAEYDETLGQYVLNGVAYSGKEVDLYIHVYIEETDPDTTGSTGSVVRAQVYGERGAAFVNTYSGSLTLRKTVTGVNGDQSRDWRFTVTLKIGRAHV